MNPPSLCIERLHWPELTAQDLHADVLRLDLLHPIVSGNKWFKLQRHLQLAEGHSAILTFGGAWSNHLVATAYAAHQTGLKAIGIVRGEPSATLSVTLQEAAGYGMQLEFISRHQYAEKEQPAFLQQLTSRFPGAYIIPEGGGGLPGIMGSETILSKINADDYTHICCAIGTGTTWLGLVRSSTRQSVIGVPVLKGIETINTTGILTTEQHTRAHLLMGYHFGGYAKHPQPLLDFMNWLYTSSNIPTDIVYTGKLFYAIHDSIRRHLFPTRSRLLIIHSGGLQGNRSLRPGQLLF